MPRGEAAESVAKLPVGAVFETPCLQSTSFDKRIAYGFSSTTTGPSVVLKIHAPKGTKALLIEKAIKASFTEKEVILSKGLKLKVTANRTVQIPYQPPRTIVIAEVLK